MRADPRGVGRDLQIMGDGVTGKALLCHHFAADQTLYQAIFPSHPPQAQLLLGQVAMIDDHRRVRQVGVARAVGCDAFGRMVAIAQFHLITIGQDDKRQHAADIPLSPRPECHRFQHHAAVRFALAGIGIGGKFRLAEHIHHAMVAQAVTRAEILVGVIVKGAPADGPGDLGVAIHGVQHIEMAGDMFGLTLFLIVAFGRVHMAAKLGNHIGHNMA